MKRAVLTVLIYFATLPAFAETAWVSEVLVTRTLVQDGAFGNCMALLEKNVEDTGLNCPGKWVSFSCDGTFTKQSVAYRMFDSAQMALALEKKVSVKVDDTKKHNSYCVAYRIDVHQ